MFAWSILDMDKNGYTVDLFKRVREKVMIVITLDLEWAPAAVIEDSLELLDRHDLSATLFSTHEDGVDASGHERALHPNFLRGGEKERDVIADLAATFPEASGIRSHSLYIHSRLRNHYEAFELSYESNYLMYGVEGIKPFEMPSGTVQFPIYFTDDDWLGERNGDDLPDIKSLLAGNGLKVFDFHPPHIAFNTPSIERYEACKDDYWDDSTGILDLRWNGKTTGVRDLFEALLEELSTGTYESTTLGALEKRVRNGQGI